MHDEHDHHHHHHHPHEGSAGPGHNRGPRAVQWQVQHAPSEQDPRETPATERDLDLVEASFVEGFARCSDPTSFLRLARVPFVGAAADGRRLHLLRVETDEATDVGAVAPLLGGDGVRYDPLPARMVSRRRRLALLYHDGRALRSLSLAEARALADETSPTMFAVDERDGPTATKDH